MTIDQIRQIVVACDPACSHWRSTETERDYTVWHEFRRETLWGDNDEAEGGWHFQVDRFTKEENDPMVEQIWRVLRGHHRIAVSHTVLDDPGTEYIHHVFTCTGV